MAGALPLNLSRTTFWTIFSTSLVNSASQKKNPDGTFIPLKIRVRLPPCQLRGPESTSQRRLLLSQLRGVCEQTRRHLTRPAGGLPGAADVT